MENISFSTAMGGFTRCPSPVARRNPSTPAARFIATMTTAISSDGTQLAISDSTQDGKSRIYVLPIAGGAPRLITPWRRHIGTAGRRTVKTLAYCAERNGQYDIYTIPVEGGGETRLTTASVWTTVRIIRRTGIYLFQFRTDRQDANLADEIRRLGTGTNHIRRPLQLVCASVAERRWIVFLSYAKDVTGHRPTRMCSSGSCRCPTGKFKYWRNCLAAGTINVPSWSPDSQNVAFVSYQLVYP